MVGDKKMRILTKTEPHWLKGEEEKQVSPMAVSSELASYLRREWGVKIKGADGCQDSYYPGDMLTTAFTSIIILLYKKGK